MKKITALLILIFVFTTVAHIAVAADVAMFSDTVEFSLDRENERLTISGITSSCRSNVPVSIMLLLPPDDGVTTIDSSQTERDSAFNARLTALMQSPTLIDSVIENVYEVKTVNTSEKNGVFTHSFDVGGDGGLYRLIIKTDDGDSFTKDFYFFPRTYYNTIVQNVNSAASPINNDNYSVKHYLENEIKIQDMFYDLYKNQLTDKGISTDRIYTEIFNRKSMTAFASYNELEAFVKRQIATTALYSGNSSVFDAVLSKKEYTDALKLTWEDNGTPAELNAFKNFKDGTKTDNSDKNAIIEYLSHSTGSSDYEFSAAVFMNEYSRLILWSQVKPHIVSYYDSVLGLKYSQYTALTDTQAVDKALIGEDEVFVYNRFEDFKEAFNNLFSSDAVGGEDTSSSDNGGSNNSGGGGGSGGSGTKIEVSSQLKEEAANTSVKFYDLENALWAQEAIYELAKKGIVSGTGNGCFSPSDYITREQFLTMIVRLYDLKAEKSSVDFMDTKSDAWYYPYIAAGTQNGIINGIGNGMFGIGSYISRQDMALIASRALELFADDKAANNEKSFSDITSVDDYARDAVMNIAGMGIINGYEDGSFRPHGLSTRAEAAKIIYGLCLMR